MKKMKTLLLSLIAALTLLACGAEQTATYVSVTVEEGIEISDTQVVKAKGDKVLALTETTTMDLSETDAEMKELLVSFYDEAFGEMKNTAPAGVTISFSEKDGIYTAVFDIDLETADLQELINGQYVTVASNNADTIKYVSFKQTCEGLEASGYTLQK